MSGNGITRSAARDIRSVVGKVLLDLSNPEPPLRLEEVRHLLELDRTYYSTDDHSLFRRAFHKMTIAGKQIVSRPGLIKDVVSKRKLRALWEPDARQILIDKELPAPKKVWAEAHEIGHSLLDWHETFLHGDPKHTLSIACHIEIEAEANFAAGQLLFLGDRFQNQWLDSKQTFADINRLKKVFNNSMTTTLWRAIECSPTECFGLICQHPRYVKKDLPQVDHVIMSESFNKRFSKMNGPSLFQAITPACDYRRRGPLGNGEIAMANDNGQVKRFEVDIFNNSYQTLVFGSAQKVAATSKIFVPTG